MSWAIWEDGAVVYHHPSGKTHLLNAGSVALLQDVLTSPLDPVAAAETLASLQGGLADDRLRGHVADLLARFDELGLVTSVDA